MEGVVLSAGRSVCTLYTSSLSVFERHVRMDPEEEIILLVTQFNLLSTELAFS
jgi:hypothetical protein